ncbi:NAD-dependent epimerase/dehydratase family protein [Parapedobacter koreensis]|uniref:Nucleoside-diphosphate-sugar epimerase n=1 Tax=Parapedobacter koreensis TaxID=332977 RepID=A0A1H7NSD1_9SPHI|nr:NAD-dependent epimerase/dehydratase family protein [Parapedobacter koreensis]SEL26306.1 Nucleoside-diphosphate-sugar epimerase [Parapedobacter koreensis]
MNVLVTGANGLLATNTILALLARGYRVRGLIRDTKKFLLPPQDGLALAIGDITDAASLARAVGGCDYIIHSAATTDMGLLHYEDYHRINVMGTEQVIQAALAHGVKKIVYVSTANTFGYGSLQQLGDETRPMKAPFSEAWYARSKAEGERLILAAKDRIAVTVVNPTFMIGAYDGKPSSGAIIQMGYGKKVVFHPPGGKNFVHVADAAEGVIRALERGENGAAYLLAGENLSYRDFFKKLASHSPSQPLLVAVPRPVLRAAGYLGDALRTLGIRTALSSVNMKILCICNYYSNSKAQQELGVVFRPIDAGIDDAIHWFKAHAML